MKSRYKIINTEIEVYLDEWSDDELIEEMKDRGYSCHENGEGTDVYEKVMDDIYDLYKEWKDDRRDSDTRFEKAIRKFFEKYMNKVSA
jgi:hypothetical protein